MFVDKETIVNILLFRSFVTSSQLVFSCSDGPSHITTVGPSFSQSSRFPRPNWKKGARPNWKKGGADIIVFPSILVAQLIYYSARDTAHFCDLYLASSNSFFCWVSFWMVVISACSWPSHRSFLFRKLYPPLLIVHPRSGSRHVTVVKPSLVLILVSSSRSSHTCDKSCILMKPLAGISWSRIQVYYGPITSCISCSTRRWGSYAAAGIEGASL